MFAWVALAAASPSVPPVIVAIEAPARPAAGEPFEVAVVLAVPKDWHVYWENPGQSGLATEVALTAGGAPTSAPAWPTPTRFTADGITSYGYSGETAFVFTVPAREAGPVELAATASWLLCKDICVRGEGAAKTRVTVSTKPTTTDVVAPFRARLPRPFADSGGTATLVDGKLTVRLPGPGPFDHFPTVALEGAWAPTAREDGGAYVLEGPLPAVPAGARLVLTRDGGRQGFTLDLPPESTR